VVEQRNTVLVTGASGFVGQPLVDALTRAAYGVRAATRNTIAAFPAGVERVVVPDFTQPVEWDRVLHGVDHIVHVAGLAHADAADMREAPFDQINRVATQRLCRAATRAGVKHFVFISSIRAQAGASSPHVLHEDDDPHPTDPYGRSKLAAEMAVRTSGVPFTILRPVVIYGPNARANIRSLVRFASLPLPLPFAGFTNRRSLLAIENLTSAILFVLKHAATIGETYLVADPCPTTLSEIFTTLRRSWGRPPRLFHVPPRLMRGALSALGRGALWERLGGELVVDTAKLQAAGWHPPLDTDRGLAEAFSQPMPPAHAG
jgi:UDP-glucose 4-epimerase